MTNRSPLRLISLALLLAGCACGPAMAQMAGPGGMAGGLGPIGGHSPLHARSQSEQTAPQGLPGASSAGNVSAGPVTDVNGDPTKLLFKAINHGDYAQARAAVGRGANLEAVNALGETPIALSVELNRDRITFMLLSARAEEAPAQKPASPVTTASVPAAKAARTGRAARKRVRPAQSRAPAPGFSDPGHPDPAAGFLGFDGKG